MEKRLQKNIMLYYWFKIFQEPLFWAPILITFIQSVSNMSLSEIYFMESMVVALLIVLEVPTGALADLIGRKKIIFSGAILLIIDNLLFASAGSPLMIWLANIVWVFGFSMISGADSAFLFDSLKALGRESEFKKIQGRANGYRLFTVALCSILVGYLAEINIRLPIYLSTVFLLVNVFIVLFFNESPQIRKEREKLKLHKHWHLMKNSVLFVANHKKIKWIIGYVALLGVISKIWFFTYNPYFEMVELPIVYFGWLFFALNLVAALTSHSADWISKKVGDFKSIVLMIILIAVPIFIMGTFISKPAVLLILLQNIVRGYINPFMQNFLHSYLDSKNRATVASIESAVVGFGQLVMLSLFGLLLKYQPLAHSLQILGIFSFLSGFIAVAFYLKIFKKA